MKLIGIGGQFASGKGETCERLIYQLNSITNEKWIHGSFADNVKKIFSETFGVSREFIEHWKRIDAPAPGFDIPLRQGLTFIGDGFRGIRSTIWMDLLLNNRKQNIVLSDLRYLNESERIRSEGGLNILMWRDGFENDMPNASEQELMPFVRKYKNQQDGPISSGPFDFWLRNDGSLEELYTKIDKLVIPVVLKHYGVTWTQ